MTDQTCCDEFAGVGRRGFFRGALGVAAASALTVAYGEVFTETAYAAVGKADRVLVVVSLRGAADGLNLVVPHADPNYYKARPRIAVPSDRLLAKDGMFGLHPALAPLLPLWEQGKMAAVHAAGLPAPNRSHFSAMEAVEDADPGSKERVGWLNRLIGRDGAGSPLEAIQLGSGGVPTTQMVGPQPMMVAQDIASIALAGPQDGEAAAARRASLNKVWGGTPGALGDGARTALQVSAQFAPVVKSSATPANGAVYPDNDLAKALSATARTIRADVGAEVITVDHGSWDHHNWVGTPDSGNLKNRASELAGSLAAFFADLGPLADKVTVVTISEFGRRVVENANQGLDHGYGNVMFVLGAGVRGGRYFGNWPGLSTTVDADLLVTTDYRSVLSEVLSSRLNASPASVFPGFAPQTVGVMLPSTF